MFQKLLDQYQNGLDKNFIFIEPKPPYPLSWSADLCAYAKTWSTHRKLFKIDFPQTPIETFLKVPVWKNPDVADLFTGESMFFSRYINDVRTCEDVNRRTGAHWNTTELRMLINVVDKLKRTLQNQNRSADPEDVLRVNDKSFKEHMTKDFATLITIARTIDRSWKDKWKLLVGSSFRDYLPNLKIVYSYPSKFTESDIALKLLYHALPHPNQVSHFSSRNQSTCGYCGGEGTLAHRFIYCIALTGLKHRLVHICNLLDPNFILNPISLVTGPRTKTAQSKTVSMILSLAKFTIHNFYTKEMFSITDTHTPLASSKLVRIFVSSLKSRIRASYVGLPRNEFIELY